MKLTYRGVSYDYNPPEVNYGDPSAVGKYRGLDIRFRNPKKVPVLQPTLDLVYRGVAHTTAQPEGQSAERATLTQAPTTVASSIQEKARNLMMSHHRKVKQRQQAMLSRLDVRVGLTADDAAHYWNHIQGAAHPTFDANYDRSHAALS
jgi:hypothetical protein